MTLAKALLKRLLYATLTLLFLSLITFLADEMAPGDQATLIAGEKASLETVERLREQLGLNRPWPVRYGEFLANAARGEFGNSYYGTKEPVRDIVARNAPMTLKIAAFAILLAAFFGTLMGVIAGIWRDKWPDRFVLVFSTLGVTIPNFVLAPLLVLLFAENLDVLPGRWSPDRVAPDFYYLILPVVILSLRPMAQITRLSRASMIEVLRQEFMRFATSKGVPFFRKIVKHGLRNAWTPIITAIGNNFGILLTGSFIIERAFLLPGLGREAIESIQKGDTPMIQATTLLAGGLFVMVNLVVDLIAPTLDPRIKESQI